MTAWHAALIVWAVAGAGDTVLLDFTASWCGPCQQMHPVVERLQSEGLPVQAIDVDQQRVLAEQFRVQAIPCFVMVVSGREVGRIEGPASYEQLRELLSRGGVGVAPGIPNPHALARGQSPDMGTFVPPTSPGAAPPPLTPARSVSAGPLVPVSEPMPTAGAPPSTAASFAAPVSFASPATPVSAPNGGSTGAPEQLAMQALSASVRLRITDPNGNSVGSGTIIDSRDGMALVLTCGHVFRDSQGKLPVTIDMFGPGAPQGLQGQVLYYDLETDLGLLSFSPGVPITVARVAPLDYRVQQNDPVLTIGCSHGDDPTVRVSHIASIDKFLGPPNFQVAGQPVQGRSGGGLFSREGYVIGVCNAADPQDDEGLYSALGAIHAQLKKLNLTDMCLAPSSSSATALAASAPTPPPLSTTMSGAPAAMPTGLAASAAPLAATGLSASDQALVDSLGRQGDGAEVICIVRPAGDTQARSEIFVFDRASPELLRQLAADRDGMQARHATAMRTDLPGGATTRTNYAPEVPTPSDARPDDGVIRGSWTPDWNRTLLR